MKRSLLFISTLLLSVTLSACDNKGSPMEQTNAESTQENADERGRAHLNLHPTAGYRIRLKIDNAPGPFKVVHMGGQFDVRNEDECGRIHAMTGTPGRITSMERIPFTRISENEYEGILHLDKMQDEDYYGRGVCHWELSFAYASVIAADEDKDFNFSVNLDVPEIISGGTSTMYFPDRAYLWREGRGGMSYPGSAAPEEYVPEIRSALFSLTLTSVGETE